MPARRHAGWPRTAAAFCQRRCPSPEGRHQQGDGGCEAHCECQPHQQEGGAASRVSCHSNEGLRSEVLSTSGCREGQGKVGAGRQDGVIVVRGRGQGAGGVAGWAQPLPVVLASLPQSRHSRAQQAQQAQRTPTCTALPNRA